MIVTCLIFSPDDVNRNGDKVNPKLTDFLVRNMEIVQIANKVEYHREDGSVLILKDRFGNAPREEFTVRNF